jgi:hypothetical protein
MRFNMFNSTPPIQFADAVVQLHGREPIGSRWPRI